MIREDRVITLVQIDRLVERFLRRTFKGVRSFRITGVSENVRNLQRHMWELWGTRMVKVYGDAEDSERTWSPPSQCPLNLRCTLAGTAVRLDIGARCLKVKLALYFPMTVARPMIT